MTRASSPHAVKTEPIEVFIPSHENPQTLLEDSKLTIRPDNLTDSATYSTDWSGRPGSPDTKNLKEESNGSNTGTFGNSDGCVFNHDLGKLGTTPAAPRTGGFSFDLEGADDLLIHRQFFMLHSRDGVCYIYCWGVDAGAVHVSHVCRVELGIKATLHHCCAFNHSDLNIGPYVQAMGLYFLLHNLQNRALYRISNDRHEYTPVKLYPDAVQAIQAAHGGGSNYTPKILSTPRSSNTKVTGIPTPGTPNPDSARHDGGCPRERALSETKPIPGDSPPPAGPVHSRGASPETSVRFFGAHDKKDQIGDRVDLTATNRRPVGNACNSPLECPEAGCSRSSRRSQSLKTHTYGHYKIRPFKCERCPSKFFTHGRLKRHVGNFHICPGCSEEMSKSDLKAHKTACERIPSSSTVKVKPMRTRSKDQVHIKGP